MYRYLAAKLGDNGTSSPANILLKKCWDIFEDSSRIFLLLLLSYTYNLEQANN